MSNILMQSLFWTAFTVVIMLMTVCQGKRENVYVHLEGNRRKCFMEEMSMGSVVMSMLHLNNYLS